MVDFVKASQVFLNVDAATVEEALTFLAQKSVELGVATDAAAVLAGLKAREAKGTTGTMAGYAVPHCMSDAITEPAVLVVKFAGDVAWESMDGKPITCAIALLVPDGQVGTDFLQMLSQVAVLIMQDEFRTKVDAADDAATIADIINAGLE